MFKPKAVASGVLWSTVDCFVLEDERRVISQRGAARALTGAGGNSGLSEYTQRLPSKYRQQSSPAIIEFVLPTGGIGHGIEAEAFVVILNVYVKAALATAIAGTFSRDDHLLPSQMHLAQNAAMLLETLQAVGLASLIDEATGWQYRRQPDAMALMFERIFAKQQCNWDKMFPVSLIQQWSRLDCRVYNGGPWPHYLRSTIRKTYNMVFSTEVGKELLRRNPNPHHGHNHHQQLAPEARSYLRSQIPIVEAIAIQSNFKEDYWIRMGRQYPTTSQTMLPGM